MEITRPKYVCKIIFLLAGQNLRNTLRLTEDWRNLMPFPCHRTEIKERSFTSPAGDSAGNGFTEGLPHSAINHVWRGPHAWRFLQLLSMSRERSIRRGSWLLTFSFLIFTEPEWKSCGKCWKWIFPLRDVGPQVVLASLVPRQHFADVETSCPMIARSDPTDANRVMRRINRFETGSEALCQAFWTAPLKQVVSFGAPGAHAIAPPYARWQVVALGVTNPNPRR